MNEMKREFWRAAGILLPALLFCGCVKNNQAINDEDKIEIVSEITGEIATEVKSDVSGELSVTFLDVGQGNAILVENDGKYMLIDGGDREYASFVVSYLKNEGIEELEYVISSHYDADHLNGIVGVLHAFPCKTVFAADYVTDTRVFDSFTEIVIEKDIELVNPVVGEVYELGDAHFSIVCPDAYDYTDVNDNSVGVRIEYGENSFLICGDAGEKSETAMLESNEKLGSDVYLASHHGSAASSSEEFLAAVMPEAVVFSVGADNSYGHPDEQVLERVAKIGADVYRTDMQGTICVTSDGESLRWNVEPMESFIMNESEAEGNQEITAYILNTNTKKFHLNSCSSVSDIKSENRAEFYGLREELLEAGYEPCKRCNP